jgi:hypothetical protein
MARRSFAGQPMRCDPIPTQFLTNSLAVDGEKFVNTVFLFELDKIRLTGA